MGTRAGGSGGGAALVVARLGAVRGGVVARVEVNRRWGGAFVTGAAPGQRADLDDPQRVLRD